ncbi:MAG: RNA methyltransferase [Candidatus Binatia bacterium]|nr:RNA methyltransferase [Candidatus Binatia bacterium]
MADLYLALLHHPMLDKNGQIVATALTNMDIHDIARSALTYGVRRFYVAHPVRALRLLAQKIIDHWQTGYGASYNETRKEALEIVSLETDLDGVLLAIEREGGRRPLVVATSAKRGLGRVSFAELRRRLETDSDPYLLVLGTGWGLAPELIARCDLFLEPIEGVGDYNHLSVRSAAAIMLDRLRGQR